MNRTGDAHASALAFAGTGFDATTRARAETAEDRSKVTVGVNPLPGFPSVNRAGAHAGNGASYLGIASGSASSFSEGIHRGDGTVEVRDFAVAGDGFGVNAGDAHSTAVAVGSGRSLVEALSDATAGGGRAGGNPGRATANATARSLGAVAAHAIVRSGSGDTLGSGVARASSTGLSGEVAVSAFGAFSMRAASTVLGNAQAEAYLTETDLIVTNAVDAYAVSLVNAGHRELAPFLQAGSRAETAVTNMDEVLGLGRFGSHHNQDGAITFSGHLASKRPLVLPIPFPQPPREEGSYVLALLGLSVIEEGFDGLRFQVQIDGTTIIDISFADVVGAAAFFDDKVFTFAGANGLLPDLDVLLDVTSSSETFAMELEFILGTVPERSTFVLLVLTLAVRPAYRGSRGC